MTTPARSALICIALAASVLVLLASSWLPRHELTLAPDAIHAESGFAYTAPLRLNTHFPLVVAADGMSGAASHLELRENGKLLGPAHSTHDLIRSEGGGRFSHWNETLYFSSSDGTDPRANGRSYVASTRATLSPVVPPAVIVADIAIVLVLRGWLLAQLARHRGAVANAAMLAAAAGAAALAAGLLGVVNPTGSPPKDPALVLAIVAHVLLGCMLALAQWAMGAGVARALLRKSEPSYAQVALLGVPISLVLLAVLAALALAIPYGGVASLCLGAACLWPLFRWPLPRERLHSLLRVLPGILASGFAFGCWMSLLWHGPTATIPGAPSGDQIFYSTAISALSTHPFVAPFGWPNLANEGEVYSYFNSLLPAVGAALLRGLPLDGFLFICSSAAIAIVGAGLALHAYLTERRLQLVSFETAVLVLGLVAAGRTPSWLVYSPAVAFVVPLTVSVWFWTARGRRSPAALVIALSSAIIGSALSKVVSAGTLAPLACARLATHLRRMPRTMQIGLAVVAAAGAAYAAYMFSLFLPLFVNLARTGTVGVGPRSLDLLFHWGYSLDNAWPYAAQDAGIILIGIAACRLMDWPEASAAVFGLLLVLAYPFLTFVNLMCVIVMLALAAIDEPVRLRRSSWLVGVALLLASAPMIFADEADLATGMVWALVIMLLVIVVVGSAMPAADRALDAKLPLARLTITVLAVAALALVASARGTLVLNSNWPGGSDLTPQVRDIWRAVSERVLTNALVFTDQTGPGRGFLQGWNSFVQYGQRQVYFATWIQSPELQANPVARDARLKTNQDVLSGVLDPARVSTKGTYGSFYAVVSAGRQLPSQWHREYANRDYALYQWTR